MTGSIRPGKGRNIRPHELAKATVVKQILRIPWNSTSENQHKGSLVGDRQYTGSRVGNSDTLNPGVGISNILDPIPRVGSQIYEIRFPWTGASLPNTVTIVPCDKSHSMCETRRALQDYTDRESTRRRNPNYLCAPVASSAPAKKKTVLYRRGYRRAYEERNDNITYIKNIKTVFFFVVSELATGSHMKTRVAKLRI